jgi:hypothetical protein
MKIRVRALVRASLLLSVIAGPLIPKLSAGTIVAYSFAGTISTVSPEAMSATGVMENYYITGTFSYDSSQIGSAGLYTFTGSSKVHTLAFTIYTNSAKTTQVFTDKYSGNSTAYFAAKVTYNSSGTTLALMGDSIYKQGLGYTHALDPTQPPAFDLVLTNLKNAGGYTPTNLPLPTVTTAANFVATPGLLSWDPPPMQTFTADITHFAPGLNGVPEPSSLILGSLGMASCAVCVLISRCKAVRALRSGRIETSPSPRP